MNHQPELMPKPSSEPNERDAELEEYLDRLRKRLQDPEFRAIEGFPLGEDEDILVLSDPPYYTACPNPFVEDLVDAETDSNGPEPDEYHREPFAADVSEGKYHPFYRIHPYPTKVPHKVIMRYILHYTDPDDIVFDGFCGTGMTGLAAQLSGKSEAVTELGYTVLHDGSILNSDGEPFSKLGARRAILNDLCPSATFIAYNCLMPIDTAEFERKARQVLAEVEQECGWMFLTLHEPTGEQIEEAVSLLDTREPRVSLRESDLPWGRAKYTAWSDVFVCPECAGEMVFWEAAVDVAGGRVNRSFACPHCGMQLTKRDMDRAWSTRFDKAIDRPVRQAKRVPVLVSYSVGRHRFQKQPDAFDLALIGELENREIPHWFPTDRLPDGYNTRQPMRSHGLTHVHHFYTPRNLWTLSSFVEKSASQSELLFVATRVASRITKRYGLTHQNGVWGAGGGPMTATLYVPSLVKELAMHKQLRRAVRDHAAVRGLQRPRKFRVMTNSSSQLSSVQDNCIDYIFVDPPFGGNLMYSELNFLWEAWLRVFTNNNSEAIENSVQGKGASQYQRLMTHCFREYYRILKPGRWMTVEFHNSKNRVWNAIQEALQRAGFVVADVRTLDKKKKTYKQATASGAVKQDLIISAYKPSSRLEDRFQLRAASPEGAWDFIRQHLAQLPVAVRIDGQLETLSERQDYLLFDRMVAFHIQRGSTVPMSAAEFYQGLRERFVERDGMFFLPDQVPEYDRARLSAESVSQLSFSVDDEKSAIQWLRQQLDPKAGGHPQTYQDIQPKFLQQLHQARHEELPELSEILEQSFLKDEHDRWYVPDPNKASDLEKLRRKALLREFREYVDGRGRLRKFRTDAVRAGFADAWQSGNYRTIVEVAERLPEDVLQQDPDLLMYYDNASLRVHA